MRNARGESTYEGAQANAAASAQQPALQAPNTTPPTFQTRDDADRDYGALRNMVTNAPVSAPVANESFVRMANNPNASDDYRAQMATNLATKPSPLLNMGTVASLPPEKRAGVEDAFGLAAGKGMLDDSKVYGQPRDQAGPPERIQPLWDAAKQSPAVEQGRNPPKVDDDPNTAADEDTGTTRLADQKSQRYTDHPELRAQDLTAMSQNHPDWMDSAYHKLGPEQGAATLGQAVANLDATQMSDAERTAKLQALSKGFGQADVADQAAIAQAAGKAGPAWANRMGLVLKQEGPSDAARTAFVDATWDKATAKNGDAATPIYARAAMDALSGSQDLVNSKLAGDRAGVFQAIDNGLQTLPTTYSHSEAFKADGPERVIAMAGKYQGPDARDLHNSMFTTFAAKLGSTPDPHQKDLAKGLGLLYAANAGQMSKDLYGGQSPYRDLGNEAVPHVLRDALFVNKDQDVAAALGAQVPTLQRDDPRGLGMMMELIQDGYSEASTQITKDKQSRDQLLGVVKAFGTAAVGLAVPEMSPWTKIGMDQAVSWATSKLGDMGTVDAQKDIAQINQKMQEAARPAEAEAESPWAKSYRAGQQDVDTALKETSGMRR
ncbi:MAG TPA: hypothetical protein VFA20_20375 [Myxococcaceae bacterium]|nr:hypothetical protein [Myxococcaceae bacterium]